ncbi:PLP-dependent transferase, partial [Pseudomonas aeruginosa]|uniref:PLP-dependent transferase n=1 Tax=Pseudomonas aeruginosa TaxID=287 RepID=UPI0015BEE292
HSPGLQGDPGHSLWKRDFKVAGSLCTISLKENSRDVAMDFIDRLRIFKIGAGFGGAQSLAAAYPDSRESGGFMIRLHFGLEDEGLLIADLENALNALFKDPPNGRQ